MSKRPAGDPLLSPTEDEFLRDAVQQGEFFTPPELVGSLPGHPPPLKRPKQTQGRREQDFARPDLLRYRLVISSNERNARALQELVRQKFHRKGDTSLTRDAGETVLDGRVWKRVECLVPNRYVLLCEVAASAVCDFDVAEGPYEHTACDECGGPPAVVLPRLGNRCVCDACLEEHHQPRRSKDGRRVLYDPRKGSVRVQGGSSGEGRMRVAVERKSEADAIQSLFSGHLKDQEGRMNRLGPAVAKFLLLDFDPKLRHRSVDANKGKALLSKQLHMQLEDPHMHVALARSEDRRVAQAASTCLAVARGERPAQETLTRQALEPDAHPVLLALAASSAEVVRARAALTERWGCLNPFVPVFCLDAAVDLINSRGAAAVRDFELLRENLYQLEQSMVALSNPQLWTSAIRLAARLPREDPWRRSLRSWQWELEHLLREHPARVAFARSHVNAATGIQRLVHGETEARVRDAWEGAALAHWELEAFRSRFGHPYAEDR